MTKLTLADVALHDKRDDLWMVINGQVLDITKFVDEHPGGEEVLLEHAGIDATEAFDDVGHSDEARALLDQYYVGELKTAETKKADPASTNKDSSASSKAAAAVSATATKLNQATSAASSAQASEGYLKFLLPLLIVLGAIVYKYVI